MSEMSSKVDICIVGGGAAGLVAAITAAGLGKKVCLFDSNKQLGKKLLSTGNGRCNYTNSNMDSSFFYSNSKAKDKIIDQVLSQFSYEDTVKFFESIGINGVSINGYYYPYTNQATSIREALEREVKALGVTCYIDRRVTSVEKDEAGFRVLAYNADVIAKSIIIATGGLVGDKLGCIGDGYTFAKDFGHCITDTYPALTALMFDDKALSALAGVRANGSILGQTGEIQWNKDNISGIPVMCASHLISQSVNDGKSREVVVDLLPEVSLDLLVEAVSSKQDKYGNFSIKEALFGLVNEKCIDYCLNQCSIDANQSFEKISHEEIYRFCSLLKNIKINVIETKDFNGSQVTAGGISIDQINPFTMESIIMPGLYFAGEVLDVDGICGGYNLQWAFATGAIAAKGASN